MKKQKELSWDDIKASLKELSSYIAETNRTLDEKFSRTEKMIANSNERIEGISKSNGGHF